MEIRKAISSDIPALIDLFQQVQGIHVSLFPEVFKELDLQASSEWFDERLNEEDTVILISFDETGIHGYLLLEVVESPEHLCCYARKCVYIGQICVAEEFRGKGLGKMLVEEAKGVARDRGIDRVELNVWSENKNARDAFASLGFSTYNEKMVLLLD